MRLDLKQARRAFNELYKTVDWQGRPFLHHPIFASYRLKTVKTRLFRNIPPRIDVLLDVGCGRGDSWSRLRDRTLVENLAGFDLSIEILKAARGNASRFNTQLVLSPAEFLPVRDGLADMVVASEVLEHVSSPALVISETARALKTGGQLRLSTPSAMWEHSWVSGFPGLLETGLNLLARSLSRRNHSRQTATPRITDEFLPIDEIVASFSRYGLRVSMIVHAGLFPPSTSSLLKHLPEVLVRALVLVLGLTENLQLPSLKHHVIFIAAKSTVSKPTPSRHGENK